MTSPLPFPKFSLNLNFQVSNALGMGNGVKQEQEVLKNIVILLKFALN